LIYRFKGKSVNSYQFSNVKVDHTISASFTAVTSYTIHATADANGNISPTGDVSVAVGGSQTFAITGLSGYHVADVKVDGVSVGAVTSYTFNNIQADHTIAATTSNVPYKTITSSSTPGGTISPLGPVLVTAGNSQIFTLTADTGYHVSDVKVDGV